jgi:hypothetical protein
MEFVALNSRKLHSSMGFALWALMGSEIERKGSFIHAEGAQNGHLRVVFKASRAENTMRRGGLA